MVKNITAFPKDQVQFLYTHGSLQLSSITSIPEDPRPSSGSSGTCIHKINNN